MEEQQKMITANSIYNKLDALVEISSLHIAIMNKGLFAVTGWPFARFLRQDLIIIKDKY